jgi:hypothetical protein
MNLLSLLTPTGWDLNHNADFSGFKNAPMLLLLKKKPSLSAVDNRISSVEIVKL